jgi:hypothetical protein
MCFFDEIRWHHSTKLVLHSVYDTKCFDQLLSTFCRTICDRYKASGILPAHFTDIGILELPASSSEALSVVQSEIVQYIKAITFNDEGASVEIFSEIYGNPCDHQLYEELSVFLFTCSEMPYTLMKSESECIALAVSKEEILFWNQGKINRVTISEIFNPPLDEIELDSKIEAYLEYVSNNDAICSALQLNG